MLWLLRYEIEVSRDFGEILPDERADPDERGVQHPEGVRFLRNEKKNPKGCVHG